jgi:hypothetical protein
MARLDSLRIGLVLREDYQHEEPDLEWDVLPYALLGELLTSCTLLTRISFKGTVLDQAGLDLLLSRPHITSVEVMAIAATESRVDSPCSWHTLDLPTQVDVRTVAYVPLHSLSHPLDATTLLLPPDVPTAQLPELVLAATTRMAQQRHLFHFAPGVGVDIEVADWIPALDDIDLGWPDHMQDLFSPEARLALIAALEPLVQIPAVTGLWFEFHSGSELIPRLEFGREEVQALDSTWGSRLHRLNLIGVQLAEGFFPAIETAFPNLILLGLCKLKSDNPALQARLMLMCQRITRPLKVELDWDYLQ